MRVLVCVKRVPAPGARINITADGQAVDTAFLGFTMSPHEECAVEEAVQLIERHGGESTVLTLGPAEADEQLRYAASLGVTKAVLLPIPADGTGDWDPQRTAASIAAAIADIEATDGAFDIILFGNESADSGGFQVAIRVAHVAAADRSSTASRASRSPTTTGGLGPRPPRVRRRGRGVLGADAGGARRQGRHQPAALPHAEGPPGVEEGRRRPGRCRRASPAGSAC